MKLIFRFIIGLSASILSLFVQYFIVHLIGIDSKGTDVFIGWTCCMCYMGSVAVFDEWVNSHCA